MFCVSVCVCLARLASRSASAARSQDLYWDHILLLLLLLFLLLLLLLPPYPASPAILYIPSPIPRSFFSSPPCSVPPTALALFTIPTPRDRNSNNVEDTGDQWTLMSVDTNANWTLFIINTNAYRQFWWTLSIVYANAIEHLCQLILIPMDTSDKKTNSNGH